MYCNIMLKILNLLKVITRGWYRPLTFTFLHLLLELMLMLQ